MSKTVKLRRIGSSHGFTLPKEFVQDLGVREGDEFYVLRTPDGLQLTPFDPDFADVIDDARDYMRRHRNAMRKLAQG